MRKERFFIYEFPSEYVSFMGPFRFDCTDEVGVEEFSIGWGGCPHEGMIGAEILDIGDGVAVYDKGSTSGLFYIT